MVDHSQGSCLIVIDYNVKW